MTCRDIMTENPTCCTPTDTAARAAQIMKKEDVGPVPVVANHTTKQLVGIVTDRDLALKVVAEGRDPNAVYLQEIMSQDVVTCSPDDDVVEAMEAMARHQVRRIPIVDEARRLVGIIAQADVARHMEEREVGDVVEDISEPGGFGSRMVGGAFRGSGYKSDEYDTGRGVSGVLPVMIGFGVGAGLLYLLDPNSGRRRRAKARRKAYSWSTPAALQVNRRARDIGNRASGALGEARPRYSRAGQHPPEGPGG